MSFQRRVQVWFVAIAAFSALSTCYGFQMPVPIPNPVQITPFTPALDMIVNTDGMIVNTDLPSNDGVDSEDIVSSSLCPCLFQVLFQD